MKVLELDPKHEPQFSIGDRVWTVIGKVVYVG